MSTVRPFRWRALSKVHSGLVLSRRMGVLAHHLHRLMPEHGTVLDVGCGNGMISKLIMTAQPGVSMQGIDVLERPTCAISMQVFDGSTFPFPAKHFDMVMFVDVLHHTPEPLVLLQEAFRVARSAVVVKDHYCDTRFAKAMLSLMDWVGNRPHGVSLPYNYLSSTQWLHMWEELGVVPDTCITSIGLYPWLVRPMFEHGLHFIARVPVVDSAITSICDGS